MDHDIIREKAALRKLMRQKRAGIPDGQKSLFSGQICREILNFLNGTPIKRVGIYLATPAEPQVDALITPLQEKAVEVFAPHFQDEEKPFYLLAAGGENIEISTYQSLAVRTPATFPQGKAVSSTELDLILIPGLAFDTHGNRLGQGGGWYDRVLSKAPEAAKMGVCFDSLLSDQNLPHEPHDEIMDYLVTENRFLNFADRIKNGVASA